MASKSARFWAEKCLKADGTMRSWLDLPGHAVVDGAAGVDVMLWTSSLLLLHHLESQPRSWEGVRVLEMSGGTGHLAVGMARLGASVISTECSLKHSSTALDALKTWSAHLLRERPDGGTARADGSHSAGASGGTLAFQTLDWGDQDGLPSYDEAAAVGGFPDVILLSELVALGEELQAQLLATLKRLLGPRTVVYSIFCERPFSMGFLWMLSEDESFEVETLELDGDERLGLNDEEIVYLHKITRPRAVEIPYGAASREATTRAETS